MAERFSSSGKRVKQFVDQPALDRIEYDRMIAHLRKVQYNNYRTNSHIQTAQPRYYRGLGQVNTRYRTMQQLTRLPQRFYK